jgi:hypothetical protein
MKTVKFTKKREVANVGETRSMTNSAAENLVKKGYAEYVSEGDEETTKPKTTKPKGKAK